MDALVKEHVEKPGAAGHGVSMAEVFRVWLRVALLSFSGRLARSR